MNIQIFVQARMGSTRLPGKILKPVLGKPLLLHLTERLQQTTEADSLHILTTTNPIDQQVVDLCTQKNISVFRGPNEDVLKRYFEASKKFNPDAIVRITADCPLIDPEIIDGLIKKFRDSFPKWDYMSNSLTRTFPRGLDVEIFSSEALTKAYTEASDPRDREHVTLYIYEHPDKFKCTNVPYKENLSHLRLTVDTPEDFKLIKLIIEDLYPQNPHYRLTDILTLLRDHPDWPKINAEIKQKPV